jgi:hypothetical protein
MYICKMTSIQGFSLQILSTTPPSAPHIWIQGLMLAWQVLKLLSYTLSPFYFCFSGRVLILPEATLDINPPTYTFLIAGIIDTYHYTQDCLLRWGLTNFLTRPTLNLHPPHLHIPRNWGYKGEPPCLATHCSILQQKIGNILPAH